MKGLRCPYTTLIIEIANGLKSLPCCLGNYETLLQKCNEMRNTRRTVQDNFSQRFFLVKSE